MQLNLLQNNMQMQQMQMNQQPQMNQMPPADSNTGLQMPNNLMGLINKQPAGQEQS